MRISEDLSAALAAADDDYLIGLCNKGTVNRAKKDLAALSSLEAVPENGGMTVKLGDITCSITSPLGESRCSCPSSAICRHRIAAILWLKQQLDGGPPAAAPPSRRQRPRRAFRRGPRTGGTAYSPSRFTTTTEKYPLSPGASANRGYTRSATRAAAGPRSR